MFYDTIILGSGASGTMCAMNLRKKSVAIIDKQNKIAKKILATGNGRCNLTNLNISSQNYNQNLDKYFQNFNQEKTIKFFNNIGLEVYSDDENRVYPLSNTAKSVIDVITNDIEKKNISIFLEHNIEKISYKSDIFEIKTDKNQFTCKNLVIATGGQSSTDFIKEQNIPFKPFVPSLVSLKINNSKNLVGMRIGNVKVTLHHKNKEYSEYGEILFREHGISGICIFNLSSILARENNFSGQVSINLLPKLKYDEILELLHKRKALNIKVSKFFDGLFAQQIGYEILNRCNIDETKNTRSLTDEELEKFVKIIQNLNFEIKDCLNNNQIYSGGVMLSSLTNNLQSKKNQNLYFCGEICDVDGICGGFNLQWAWTSGIIVANALNQK